MNCDFCEGKLIPPDGFGSTGIHTISQNISYLFGKDINFKSYDYIRLFKDDNKYFLIFQNSSGEYSEGFIAIKYCPMCGKKLGT